MSDEVKTMLEAMQQETRSQFQAVRQEMSAMREEINSTREEMNERFARAERENAAAHAETRRHTEVVLETFVRPKIEAIVETVALLDERVTRETADIRTEMRQGFADTHDLIRFVLGGR